MELGISALHLREMNERRATTADGPMLWECTEKIASDADGVLLSVGAVCDAPALPASTSHSDSPLDKVYKALYLVCRCKFLAYKNITNYPEAIVSSWRVMN